MPIVQTDVVGTGLILASISHHDVRAAIAIEIHHSDIARRPARITKCFREREVTLSIVEINELLVWRVIADNKVKIAVTVQVGESCDVGPICLVTDTVPLVEVSLPIIQEDEIN